MQKLGRWHPAPPSRVPGQAQWDAAGKLANPSLAERRVYDSLMNSIASWVAAPILALLLAEAGGATLTGRVVGIDDGDTIRFQGLGEAGEKGGIYGDFYLTVRVLPHKFFKRAGYDIYLEQPISFTQVALGDVIEIPTIDSKVKLKIPEGTQTDTEFRLAGKGIKHGNYRGDQYVRVKLITPKNLSQRQKEALRELE